MRVALYARVSAVDQSPERQVRELRSYAQARDWQIVHEAEEISGKDSQRRPQRENILRMARCREIPGPSSCCSLTGGKMEQGKTYQEAAQQAGISVSTLIRGHRKRKMRQPQA